MKVTFCKGRRPAKAHKAIASLLLALVVLSLSFVPAGATVDYQGLRESVFRVIAVNASEVPISLGSGFAIGASRPISYIVTCLHVVEPKDKDTGAVIVPSGIYVYESNDTLTKCTVVKRLEDLDLVIMKAERAIDRPPMLIGTVDMVKVTDEVYAYGFPTADVSTYQLSQPENVTVTKGTVNKKTEKDGVNYYQFDATINPGSSGGPLVHTDGYVIGINVGTIAGGVNVNASIQIDQILPTLGEMNIEYLSYSPVATAAATPGDQSSASPSPSQDPAATPTPEPGNSGGGSAFWLVVFIFAGIAFLGVSGYLVWQFLLQRKAAAAAGEGDDYIDGQPMLRGVGGQYDGALIPIQGTIAIGRDPGACQVVYPRDMPGISRMHCQIRFDSSAGVFVLKDLSTEGTIAGGRPVGKGRSVSLQPGSYFYLVDRENGFRVERADA